MLGGNAAMLQVTDGLEQDEADRLTASAAQLRRLAHQTGVTHPLLRFDGFEPRTVGVRTLAATGFWKDSAMSS